VDRKTPKATNTKARHNVCRKRRRPSCPSALRRDDENGNAMPTMNMNAGWIMSHAPPPIHAACEVL
jgi:hypothetical protein